MSNRTSQLVRRAIALEQRLSELAGSNAPAPEQAALIQEFRMACEDVIFADFEFACSESIEARLWAAHLTINTVFRKGIRHLRHNNKDKVVEYRKLEKPYLAFIKASQKFYRQFILNLDVHFDGIPELRKVAEKTEKWKETATRPSSRDRIPSSLKHKVLLSCHQTLIQLGDLSRYRETELVEKNRNWGPAIGYYELAASIYPDSGQSHNQQAVIAREDGNHFRCTYHLYRSLASKEPHPMAKKNLELGFKKIVTAWEKGELINNHRSPDGNTVGRALVAWFVRLHSKCYKGEEFAQHEELENEVLSHIAIELKERSLDSILQKIILTNLSAEYFATVQMQDPNPPTNIFQTYFYYCRLNVKTFFTLLQILQPELERIHDDNDVTKSTQGRERLDKVTAVARRVLPGLRLYSIWFSRFWQILDAKVANTLSNVEVQELWKAYAETLTLLAMTFPTEELPADDYMLEEDVETIGFQPLFSDKTKRTWFKDGVLKRKWSEGERSHPNVEMRMRIRDLLVDGLTLTQNAEAPLDLDGLRFIYREAGLPSELLASPNNHTIQSPSIPAEPLDMPIFPQGPTISDDQVSHSVAPSESASTVLAKDTAMSQMVDDLVGPDDGLDALPEEDENLPPTPPEQTFEDTTMVSETTFGIGPIIISDLVNAVQNCTKPMGSPRTPIVSTPMNRAMSSSSIRQPANLPSLPDGQSNGRSIWSTDYHSTPGPSSPSLGTIPRGSPLNGMRQPSYAHADSFPSGRVLDRAAPSAPAAPYSGPGRLGSSAAWGNSGMGYYGTIYGDHTNRGGTDLALMDPLLLGNGTWNAEPQHGVSNRGHSPYHGQGG